MPPQFAGGFVAFPGLVPLTQVNMTFCFGSTVDAPCLTLQALCSMGRVRFPAGCCGSAEEGSKSRAQGASFDESRNVQFGEIIGDIKRIGKVVVHKVGAAGYQHRNSGA